MASVSDSSFLEPCVVEDDTDENHERMLLETAMQQLPEDCSLVVRMYQRLDSYEECAQALRCSTDAFAQRLSRANKKLVETPQRLTKQDAFRLNSSLSHSTK